MVTHDRGQQTYRVKWSPLLGPVARSAHLSLDFRQLKELTECRPLVLHRLLYPEATTSPRYIREVAPSRRHRYQFRLYLVRAYKRLGEADPNAAGQR